jgi:hypothetical protein
MLGNVLANLCIISSIDSDGDAASEETAVEGIAPFWCIESDDVDGCKLIKFVGD